MKTLAKQLKKSPIISITFNDEDCRGIQFPHDDALVVILLITDFVKQSMLVDNSSSIDILFYITF